MEVCSRSVAALVTVAALAARAAAQVGEDAAAAPEAAAPEEDAIAGECYTGGNVAGAVVGTFIATLVLIAAVVLLYKFYWRGRRGKHLILTKDPEAGGDQYAFDNPCFRDGSPLARSPEKEPIKMDQKAKWSGWPSLTALAGNKGGDKRRALDDSCLTSGDTPAQPRLVTLRSRDFTGLGFNVCGNMRDGIFVRDVQHRGPAFESGRIQPGDRIEAVRISFRHMVFEDALTILSYASPYEVQLELESAAPAAPAAAAAAAVGSLLRPRRGAAPLNAAERIIHPFFRSQSSADLAQINKASLRRAQQMGGVGGGKTHQLPTNEDQGANEYPTLKLSSSPTHPVKENTRLEKTAPTAVVKPERVKRASTPKEPDLSPTSESSTLSKFQKFGVRVLPDPAPRQTTEAKPATIEAEKHQNEQNLIKERVSGSPVTEVLAHDTVDADNNSNVPLHYDERGIDVGPVNVQLTPTPRELKAPTSEKQFHRNVATDDEDGHKEHNVKQLLTKGLQNLKEKLHHDKRTTTSPESPVRNKDKKQKPARQHKTSMSSDSEGLDGERSVEGTIKSKNKPQEPEKMERKRQRNPERDGPLESLPPPPGSGIPSEIPEEVRRAAAAARSNRKSLQIATPVMSPQEIKDINEFLNPPSSVRETVSDSSSDEGGTDANSDSTGRPPKRSNKRKAPPPPAEEAEHNLPNNAVTVNNSEVGRDLPQSEDATLENIDSGTINKNPESNNDSANLKTKLPAESGTVINKVTNVSRQNLNVESSGKEVTNITIDDTSALASLETERPVDAENGGQGNSFPVDSSSSGTSTMETKTGDYSEGLHVNTVNSDSDSDLERLEGDADSYDRKRGKKGGTTIELNSSHITIHHSPSSETMQMGSTDLDSDSTRKAASLGDLSRLDSEQPMSILERAVSLDLGDGSTPHSSKKRKAPLPPPGEEYLSAVQDSEDGAHYRKEPRLDNAMDTFQRRRLKKSSDWGTLEEALKQTDTSSTSTKVPITEAARMEMEVTKHEIAAEPQHGTQNEVTNLADDQKVQLSGLASKFMGTVRAEALDLSGIEPLDEAKANTQEKTDTLELSGRSSPECDHSTLEPEHIQAESLQQKKTVLHISPGPTKKTVESNPTDVGNISSIIPSQVTIASSSVLGLGEPDDQSINQEIILSTASESHRPPISPRPRTGNIISSTPLPNRERAPVSQISPVSNTSITEESYVREALQSPLVTSSDAGISNVHVVSSTTTDTVVPTDVESSHLVSSATDHFITAASVVDSTSAVDDISDNDDTWGNDQQPPELPTSPVPVLSQASTSFPGSPSMTYITEIQVVTTTNGDNNETLGTEVTHNGTTGISSSFIQQGMKNNKSDSSVSSDSLGGGGITIDDIDIESHSFQPTNNSSISHIPRSSVTVTSIRTSDTTGGQSGGTVTETTNHVGEKKPKSIRPPVPPRKSDLSSPTSPPPSMSSSTIMVEVPKIRLAETASSSLLAGGSVSQISPAAAGKFISFSSLSPRAEGNTTRHGSSFEQWVFLDDSAPTGHHNGFETTISDGENGQHSNVMTLPGLKSNRTQTVTHIILDTKQNSGGQVQE